jgi:hypothetical protein
MSKKTAPPRPENRLNGQGTLTVLPTVVPATPLRIDLGCGPNPKEGFEGADQFPFDGRVKYVVNLGSNTWPWEDNTVSEAHASHFLEHLTNFEGRWERTHFFNELHRVLMLGAKTTLIIPHWCSNRYYGDPTHKEPFSEMGFYYLSREWRATQAPHSDVAHNPHGYACDFEATWGYSVNGAWQLRNQEAQSFALQWYKEAASDIIATLTKRA